MNSPKTGGADWLERILDLAEARGIPHRRIVEAAGVEPARVDKWRKGSRPTLQNLMAIAKFLDVSLDWIATGAGSAQGGFPREPVTDAERHLLWMLRSLGVSPEDAAARITAPAEGPRVLGVRDRSLLAPTPDRQPAGAGLEDRPAGKPSRVRRGRRAQDLDLPDVGAEAEDDRK
jgi:transcriptional regulator with XRE-family HTH domain